MIPESFKNQVKAFSNDGVTDAEVLWRVDYLKRVNKIPAIQRYKQEALKMICPQQGEEILDIGCGIGEEIRAMYDRTPTVKKLVGIDNSQTMVVHAVVLTPQDLLFNRAIVFQQGNAHNLSFEDGEFDASYSDRTFQHLNQPDQAFREMIRVTKCGGRLVIADTDWSTLQIKGVSPEVDEKTRNAYFNIVRNPRMGGMLQQLFIENSLKDVEVIKEPIELLDLQTLKDVLALEQSLKLASDNGLFSNKDLERCLQEIEEAKDIVQASLAIFIVKGVKLGRRMKE